MRNSDQNSQKNICAAFLRNSLSLIVQKISLSNFQIPKSLAHHCVCLFYCKDPLFKMLSNLVLRGAKRPWDGEHPDLLEAVEAAVNSAEAAADAAKPFLCSLCPFEPWI